MTFRIAAGVAPRFRLMFATTLLLGACQPAGVRRASNGGNGAVDPGRPNSADAAADVVHDAIALPTGGGGAMGSLGEGLAGACMNLQCQQRACPGGATTSVSGTVYAPNGTLPLYNVMVFVPNAPLEPFKPGVLCDRCGGPVSGKPISSAVTDAEGKFKLSNVPVGKDIPLVVQVGKWRRKVTLPTVVACQDNPITDTNLTRLPRNQREGDLPKIAVTTGTCDQLGCLLPKLGIDPTELGVGRESKAVAYYRQAGGDVFGSNFGPPNMRSATDLWTSEATLMKHDITLLSCECGEELETKGPTSFDAMTKYLANGGRLFSSHWNYVWLQHASDPQLASTVTINPFGGATSMGSMTLPRQFLTIDTTFPKGKAMADWMKFLDPPARYGELIAAEVFDSFRSVRRPSAQVWASSPSEADRRESLARIVTINTPAGQPPERQCGRASHMNIHISEGSLSGAQLAAGFPAGCGTELTKSESVLAFLIFDLAACIQDDTRPPVVPPIVVD